LGYVEEAVSVGRQAQRRGVTDHHLDELLAKMTRVHAGRRRLAACLGESSSLEWATHQDRTRSDLAAAEALLHRGEHLDAELAVVEAITAGAAATDCNEDPAAWNLVGKLWFLQRSKLAPDALRLAIRMDPDLAEAHLGLAHALAADPGALDEAEVALESFLRLSPHGADAERARRALAGLAERRARREESPPPE